MSEENTSSYRGIISPQFAQAIVKVQGQIEGAIKGKENTFFKNGKGQASKYADLSACWDACRDALQANCIAVVQFPAVAPPGYVGLTTLLVYGPTGESLGEPFHMPLKDASNPQAAGSAITYARRYALCSAVGICPEDDDGNAASGNRAAANQNVAKTATKKAQEPQKPVDDAALVATFQSAWKAAEGNRDALKAVWMTVKNSSLSEPGKTAMLTQMADVIKGTPKP